MAGKKDKPRVSGTRATTKTSPTEKSKPQQSLKAKLSRMGSAEEATPAAANATGSTSRSGAGRPKADLLGQTAEEVRSFGSSTEDDFL